MNNRFEDLPRDINRGGTTQTSRPTVSKARRQRTAEPKAAPESRSGSADAPVCGCKADSTSAQPKLTTVAAKIDVGFGNVLFIRGEGAKLSWERGQPLECVDGRNWIWSSENSQKEVVFKLLLNDQVWSQGENLHLATGGKIEVVPQF